MTMFSTIKKQCAGLSLLLTLGMIWGSGYMIARYATTHGVSPLGYAFWQSLGPALFLLSVCVFSKTKISTTKAHLLFYLISGFIGIAVPNAIMYFAAAHLPAGLLAIIVNTVPIMTYALSLTIRQERFSLIRFLGIIIGFLGIAFLVLPEGLSRPSAATTPWMLIVLLTPFCFASCAIYAATQTKARGHALTLATGMLSAATLMLLPVVFLTHQFYIFNFPFTLQDQLIFIEIILSSTGYILFFQLLKKAGAVYYSLVGGVVMLTGLFWGWLVFGEKLNLWTSFAAFFIVIGVCLVTLGQASARKDIRS